METPSSSRRVTRSQTMAASANNSNITLSRKVEESEKTMMKSRKKSGQKQQHQQQDRSALVDITNDSPIVGLAMGNLKTPLSSSSSSGISKKRGQRFIRTPGSGEALLRRQVKTLLQKVEEEADLSKIITLKDMPVFNTPANTPQTLSSNTDACLPPSLTPIPQMLDEKKHEPENDVVITRSLLLDFSDKSSDSPSKCSSSVLSYQGAFVCADDDDASSVWSIQVNASSTRDEDETEEEEEEECDDDNGDDDYRYEYVEEDENDNGYSLVVLDELCEGISNISVEEGSEFKGKHIRFVYSSDGDDEMEQVFEECEAEFSSPVISSSGGRAMLRLKGLPTPKGKHVRFPQE